MRHRRHRLTLMASLAMAFFLGCDFNPIGGGTEAEGLTGTLVTPDGHPAVAALVRLYASDSADATTVLAKSAVQAALDSTRTDSRGRYRFKKVAEGTYNLAATLRHGDTSLALFLRGIRVEGRTDIGTDTLRLAGNLMFSIRGEGSALQGARCHVPGSPWQAVSDADGICLLMGLPAETPVRVGVTHPMHQTTASATVTAQPDRSVSAGVVNLVPQPLPPLANQYFQMLPSTVALWTFNSQTGTRFPDAGPNAFTLSASGQYALEASEYGAAVSFTGNGGMLQTGYDDLLTPAATERLTFEARVRLNAYPAANAKAFVVGLPGGFNLQVGPRGQLLSEVTRLRNGTPYTQTNRSDSLVVPLGEWVDLAVSIDARPDTPQFYAHVNGVAVQLYGALNADSGVIYDESLRIGNDDEDGRPFKGDIEEIRISESLVHGEGLPLAAEAVPSGQHFGLTGSTMALWTFNEYDAQNRVRDLGPHGFHLTRSAAFPLEASPFGMAAVFQGGTARFSTPYDDRLNIGNTGKLTFEARLFMSQYPSASNFKQLSTVMGMYAGIAMQISSNGSVYIKSQKLNGSTGFWYDTLHTAPGTVPLNQWVDVALSVDATVSPSQVYVHVNGVAVQMYGAAISQAFRIYPAPFAIGNDNSDTQQPFVGKIDEVRVSNTLIHGPGRPLVTGGPGTPPTTPPQTGTNATPYFGLAASTVALWTFDSLGSNQVPDRSGNGHHLSLSGGNMLALEQSANGSAMVFDGTGQYLRPTAVTPFTISPTGRITYEARIFMNQYATTATNAKGEIALVGSYVGPQIKIYPDGSISVQGQKGSGSTYWYGPMTAPGAVPLNRWVNVAVAVDNTVSPHQVYAYIDGAPVQVYATANNDPFRIATTAYPFTIGNSSANTEPFKGKIEEIRISNALVLGAGLPLRTDLANCPAWACL